MHIKKGYQLQTIAGKSFIFLRKGGDVDMTRILSFNESSVWLWLQLEGKSFTEEDAFSILSSHYDGDSEQMKRNLKWWLQSLLEEEVIDV